MSKIIYYLLVFLIFSLGSLANENDSPLKNIDPIELLKRRLYGNNCLELSHISLRDKPFIQVMTALSECDFHHDLTSLNLENNTLSTIEMTALARLLPQLKHLRSLNLSENPLTDAGLKIIAPAMRFLTNLKYLFLKNTRITDEGIIKLLHFVPQQTTLILGGNAYGQQARDALMMYRFTQFFPEDSWEKKPETIPYPSPQTIPYPSPLFFQIF